MRLEVQQFVKDHADERGGPVLDRVVTMLMLLAALNEMIDITTTRTAATRMHPPLILFLMLGALSLVGALLAGYGMARGPARSWLHSVGFAAIMATTVYVIIDMEFPRFGLIQVKDFDRLFVELRADMK